MKQEAVVQLQDLLGQMATLRAYILIQQIIHH